MAAMVAGAVFFGYGFDQCRSTALTVWYVKALVAAVMVIANGAGYLLMLTTLTSCMCNCVSAGGMVYLMSWMTFNNDLSPLSTASAFWTLYGASYLVIGFVMGFFVNSILPTVLLVGCILAVMVMAQ